MSRNNRMLVEKRFGKVHEGASRQEMADLVEMRCGKCGKPITYEIHAECPECGYIEIKCTDCGYKFWFGE